MKEENLVVSRGRERERKKRGCYGEEEAQLGFFMGLGMTGSLWVMVRLRGQEVGGDEVCGGKFGGKAGAWQANNC